jgi:hypothetical protein
MRMRMNEVRRVLPQPVEHRMRITPEFGIEPGQFKHVGQGLEFCIALQSLRLRFLKYKQKLYFGFRTVSPPASRLTLRDSSITL